VEIIFRDNQYAYIQEGLAEGEKVVTTNLSTIVDGAPLRLGGDTTMNTQQSADTISQY
jgi:hypothetical protein